MTVSAVEFLRGQYNLSRALGDKAIVSDATLVIEGHSDLRLLAKQFPWPECTSQGEIEVPSPMGAAMWQPQQLKLHQQGQLALMETVAGHVHKFTKTIAANKGIFQATVYEGTPERFYRAMKLEDCFWVADNPDRDWESRSQVLIVTGTLFFHFLGKEIPGNIVV